MFDFSGVAYLAVYGLVITPLAVWKMIDIFIYLYDHVGWTP